MRSLQFFPLIILACLLAGSGCRRVPTLSLPVYRSTSIEAAAALEGSILFLGLQVGFTRSSTQTRWEKPLLGYKWHRIVKGRLKEGLLEQMPPGKIVCIVTHAGGTRQYLPVDLPRPPHLPRQSANDAEPEERLSGRQPANTPVELVLRLPMSDSTRRVFLVRRQHNRSEPLLNLDLL